MATIMALATRLAYALAGLLLVGKSAWASDIAVPSTYNPLPTGYSLSYDKDQWTDEFSVFHMAVADQRDDRSSGRGSIRTGMNPAKA
jgi:hypothetical protein